MRVGGISIVVQPRWSGTGRTEVLTPAAEPVHLLTAKQAKHVLAGELAFRRAPMPDAEQLATLQRTAHLGDHHR